MVYITIFFVLIIVFVIIAFGGFYLSGMIINKKTIKEEAIGSHLRDALPPGTWDAILDRHNAYDKVPLEIMSSHGYILKGWAVLPHPQSGQWILLSHGVTVSKTRSLLYADLFNSLGFNYVIYDHRFHGESKGKNISYGFYEREDMKLFMDAIKKQFSPSFLGIHGESMGSGIALMYAGTIEDGADFYILDCPYDNFFEEVRYQLGTMVSLPEGFRNALLKFADLFVKYRGGFSLRDIDPAGHIENIKKPLMIIHSEEDLYIPSQMSKNLFEKKNIGIKKLYLAEKGGHAQSYIANPIAYKNEIIDFLNTITSFHESTPL